METGAFPGFKRVAAVQKVGSQRANRQLRKLDEKVLDEKANKCHRKVVPRPVGADFERAFHWRLLTCGAHTNLKRLEKEREGSRQKNVAVRNRVGLVRVANAVVIEPKVSVPGMEKLGDHDGHTEDKEDDSLVTDAHDGLRTRRMPERNKAMEWFVLLFIVCAVVFAVSAITGGSVWHKARSSWFAGRSVGPGDEYIVGGRRHRVPEMPLNGSLANRSDMLSEKVLETAQVQLMQVIYALEELGIESVCYGPTLAAVTHHEALVSPWEVDLNLAIPAEFETELESEAFAKKLESYGLSIKDRVVSGPHDVKLTVLTEAEGKLGPHKWTDIYPMKTVNVKGLFVPVPAKTSVVLQTLGQSLKEL